MKKGITIIAFITFCFAACGADSNSIIPFVIMGICAAWLLPFALVNSREGR